MYQGVERRKTRRNNKCLACGERGRTIGELCDPCHVERAAWSDGNLGALRCEDCGVHLYRPVTLVCADCRNERDAVAPTEGS